MRKLHSDLSNLAFELIKQHRQGDLQTVEEINSQIQYWESALEELKNNYDLSGELGDRAQVLIERIQEVIRRFHDHRDRFTQLTDPPLQQFSIADAPSELALDYLSKGFYFESTNNSYYLFEIFVDLVSEGYSPPRWVLKEISDRLLKHLRNRDPDLLANQLGLLGHRRDERAIILKRMEAAWDMIVLISHFGVSELDAADAVVEMHNLKKQDGKPLSKHSMKNFFRKNFLDSLRQHQHPKSVKIAQVMTPVERVKFLSSVPVRIRKKIKAG